MRPDPESFTQSNTSSPSPQTAGSEHPHRTTRRETLDQGLLDACGIPELNELAARCQQARRDRRQPTARWTDRCLTAAPHLAVVNRGWPADHAAGRPARRRR